MPQLILPVLHVCHKDEALARLNLELCAKLDGCLDATLLLIGDDEQLLESLVPTAELAFKNVTRHWYEKWHGSTEWPSPQNHAWQSAARWLDASYFRHGGNFDAWLWWEADAVPVKSRWLEIISGAYHTKPKAIFSGVECQAGTTRYMNGVGIYPVSIIEPLADCPALYAHRVSFDISAGQCVMRSFKSISDILYHAKKVKGGGTGQSFDSDRLSAIPSDVVLYHGCTDGSLQRLLIGDQVPRISVPVKRIGPDYSISVLCHNNFNLTKECISSIRENSGSSWELIVTDNASTDGTARYLKSLKRELGESLIIVTNQTNLGFNSPNNHALTLAKGRFFVLLNNDMTVCPRWLEKLSAPFTLNPRTGISGLDNTCSEITNDCHGQPGMLEYIEGSCLMIPTDLARTHGLFSSYLKFAYCEDSDLSLRIREAGYELATVPIPMNHENRSATTKIVQKEMPELAEIVKENRMEMIRRWGFYLRKRTFSRRVLVRRRGAFGDMLFLTPVLRSIMEKWPESKIQVSTSCPEALLGFPDIKVIPWIENAVSDKFDIVYDLDLAYENRPKKHIIDAYAEVCELKSPSRTLEFHGVLNEDEWARKTIQYGLWCVLHCGPTNWPGRNWPMEKFKSLVRSLRESGWKVVLVGDPSSKEPDCDLNLTGKTNLSKLYALLKRAHLFIGIDSLPFNLAQASGIPALALFGTINPEYRLCSLNARAVHATKSQAPCLFNHHDQPAPSIHSDCDGACMNAITVKQVLRNIGEVLSTREIIHGKRD